MKTKDTISCPVSSGGELKKKLNKIINKGKSSNTKIIDDGERPVHGGLMVKDPIRPPGCVFEDPLCMVRVDQNCDRSRVIYTIRCLTCLEDIAPEQSDRYVDMTRTLVYNRMKGHLKTKRQKKT